nr:hypothetical protein [Tanacetum cinerariifolium]GEV82605.1 hypothetical protein [Tanacetum cinerariifolium]
MELKSTQFSTTAKLPLLKQGDFKMWRLRIEQYFQIQEYSLWDVIENGNSSKLVVETSTDDVGTSTGPITIKEKAKKKNDVKAIKTRFGGNEATKKTQNTLLKQLYENFSAISTKSLDSIFNRLQKLTVKKITINGSDTAGYDKAKESRNQRWTVNVEDTSSKAMVEIDGGSFDWSYMADDEAPTNMAFMALSNSEPIKVVTQKSSVKIYAPIKENNGVPLIEDWESDDEDEVESHPEKARKTVEPSVDKARCTNRQKGRMVNENNHSRVNHNANTVPKAMLTRTGLKPVTSVRPVNPKRNFQRSATYNNRNFFKKGHSHKHIEDQGYFNSGCSRHMTGNISYLTDFKEFDGVYVAILLAKEQSELLADESHVLLKVPRKNNMYSVDMKNIVPKKDLTCLVANVTPPK